MGHMFILENSRLRNGHIAAVAFGLVPPLYTDAIGELTDLSPS